MRSEPKSQTDAGIGARLKAARRRLGWSREELAFRAKLSWPAVAQIESGRREHPRPATLSALADALGVTIDYLVDLTAVFEKPRAVVRPVSADDDEVHQAIAIVIHRQRPCP